MTTGVFVGVVIEDHDLEQSPGAVSADEEVPSFTWYDADGLAEGVMDVVVGDAVSSGAVCDVQVETMLPCPETTSS